MLCRWAGGGPILKEEISDGYFKGVCAVSLSSSLCQWKPNQHRSTLSLSKPTQRIGTFQGPNVSVQAESRFVVLRFCCAWV